VEDMVVKPTKPESPQQVVNVQEPKQEKGEEQLIAQNTKQMDLDQFAKLWSTLFESLFQNIPTIYFPLKDYIPVVKNNNIEISLKNELQKEHFEPKVREILAFFRSQFMEELEDIIIHVDETFVPRKVIYDTADKMKNLLEQNPNMEEFTSILDLQVKE
jgi:hypothetical protein